MKKGSYKVQLIDVEEKDRLCEKYEKRYLYTRKASIYGCCIKLLTDVEYVKERWDDNFYSMSEDVRSHGRLIVIQERRKELSGRAGQGEDRAGIWAPRRHVDHYEVPAFSL